MTRARLPALAWSLIVMTACTAPPPPRSQAQAEPAPPAAAEATVVVDLPVELGLGAGKEPVALAAGDALPFDAGLAVARHLALEPGDLLGLELRLPVAGRRGALAGAAVTVHRPGEAAVLARAAIPPGTGAIDLSAGAGALAAAARAGGESLELRLEGASPGEALLLPRLRTNQWSMPEREPAPVARAVLRARPTHALFPAAGPVPQAGTWTVARDGHFDYGGRRLRLWGPCVHWSALSDALPDRLAKMGCNAVRLWGPPRTWYTPESVRDGSVPPPHPDMERFDSFVAACRRRGLFVMTPVLAYEPATQLSPHDINGHLEMGPIGRALVDDRSWIAGGADWEDWKKAATSKGWPVRFGHYFDERLDRLRRRHSEIMLDHRNPGTGRRWAEEETVAIWELDNENGFVHWALQKGFAEWPPYFRAKLQARWNTWLVQRYRDRAALAAAWGALPADEDPAAGGVALAPVATEAKRYPPARAADLVRFLVALVTDWNRGYAAFCRAQAPAGTGIAVAPLSADTLFQNDPAWLLANNTTTEVNCFGIYSFALTSALEAPPAFHVLDHNRVAGRPSVLYEVNAGRPNPFRAEFPLRLAAFAAWQDFDGAFWHLWKAPTAPVVPDEHYLSRAMFMPEKGDYTTCVNHQYDPAMCAAMALAGDLFVRALVAPAPRPVTFTVGADALFSLDHLRGLALGRAPFTDGTRLALAPDAPGVAVPDRAAAAPPAGQAVASGGQILWDWPNRRLVVDSPQAKLYIGPDPGTFRFADGVAIGELGAPWAAVAVVSADGLPLAGAAPSRRILVNAVADALNTGFRREPGGEIPGGGFVHPLAQRERISDPGHAPAVQQPVAFTVWLPRTCRGELAGYDFATRLATRQTVDGNRVRHQGPALFLAELTVAAWGGEAATPATTPPPAAAAAATAAAARAMRCGAWLPIEGLDWAMGAEEAHQAVRDGTLRHEAVGALRPAGDGRGFLVSGLALLGGSADVQLTFAAPGLVRLEATFTSCDGLQPLAARLGEALGRPLRQDLRGNAFETSTVTWRADSAAGPLEAVLGETQGVVSLRLVRSGR